MGPFCSPASLTVSLCSQPASRPGQTGSSAVYSPCNFAFASCLPPSKLRWGGVGAPWGHVALWKSVWPWVGPGTTDRPRAGCLQGVSTQTAKAWQEGRQSSGKGGWRGSHSSPPTKLPQHPSAPPGCRAPFLRRPKEGSTEADIPPGETPGYTKGQTGTASPRGPGCRGVGPGWAPGSRNREGSASQGGKLPPLPGL